MLPDVPDEPETDDVQVRASVQSSPLQEVDAPAAKSMQPATVQDR